MRKSEALGAVGSGLFALLSALLLAGCSPRPPQHGTRLTLVPVTNGLASAVTATDLSNSIRIVMRRFDQAGLGTPFVESPATNGHIFLKLHRMPPESLRMAQHAITNTGLLEFRMVHPESSKLVPHHIIEPGYELLRMSIQAKSGATEETLLVKKLPERGLTGRSIKRAYVTRDDFDQRPQIGFELDPEGTRLFGQMTREFSPTRDLEYRLAIVINGKLISAPVIKGPIDGGRAVIDGHFTMKEAWELALVLDSPFRVPLRVVAEQDF